MLSKNFQRSFFALVALATLTFTFSCAKSTDKDALKEVQLCLNSSAPSEAMACTTKIESDLSPQAYKLRCAAVFISEGFNTPSSFITALDKINQSSGGCTSGCSSTVGAIAALTFKNTDNTSATDRTRSENVANLAFQYCTLSQTNIYMQISSLFKIGTMAANLVYALSGNVVPTADQIEAQISNLPAADIGNMAISTYNATCQDLTNASDSTKKYCADLNAAVTTGGGDPTAVGNALKAKLVATP